MDLRINCRAHPNEQALYLCTNSSCENIMFCYLCINNHSAHQKQLINQSTAIITVQQVQSDMELFQNLLKNKQNKNPEQDHKEQKRNDIISTNIKYLKQLRQPIVVEQQQQQLKGQNRLILIGLLVVILLQIIIISSGNNIEESIQKQDGNSQEYEEILEQENNNFTNATEQIQQNFAGFQCEIQNNEIPFSISFDQFKHRDLEIVDNKQVALLVDKSAYYGKQYLVALSNQSFDIHKDKIKATFQIQGKGIMVGICSHPIQSKTKYSFSKHIGHGCYLISDEGLMYHDGNRDFNNKANIWTRFSSNSVVYMEYQQYFLDFKTNHGDEVQRIYLERELQYYNIAVILSEKGSSVTII
ncbi:hypothetical protein pb186bvf_000823 [Paramecium bursaria]